MRLRVEDVEVELNSIKILKGVTFEINRGEIAALLGPNGSGKSTILRTIFGILKPLKGVIYLNGGELNSMSVEDTAKIMGYLPQEHSETNLNVIDVVLLGRTPYISVNPRKDDYRVAEEALKLVGMEEFAERKFSELSGGEKQKAMLARIFCQETDFMLLDEPTAHLDIKSQIEVLEIIKRIVRKGKAALVAMHDINLALNFSDRVLMVRKGKIIHAGKPYEVINPETIQDVFGVRAEILKENGRIFVVPVGIG